MQYSLLALKDLSLVFGVAFLALFVVVLLYGAATDFWTLRIPNWVSLLMWGGFVIAAFVAGLSVDDLISHVGAGFLCLAIGILLFALKAIGGGDAKLFSSGALWIGFDHLLAYVIAMSLVGGVLAAIVLVSRFFAFKIWGDNIGGYFVPKWMSARRVAIPYGVAIAAGTLFVFPMTGFFRAILSGF